MTQPIGEPGSGGWDELDVPASVHLERPARRRDTGGSGGVALVAVLILVLVVGGAGIAVKVSRGLNAGDQVVGLVLVALVWAGMWAGLAWCRWLFAVLCGFWGTGGIEAGRLMDSPLLLGLGRAYLLAGGCILLHPGVRKFLRLQRGERG